MPAALTTTSARIGPRSVRTPVTRPPALVRDEEGGEDVVGAGRRPHTPELGGGDLLVRDAEDAHERGLPAQGLEALVARREVEVADGPEARGLTGLGLKRN